MPSRASGWPAETVSGRSRVCELTRGRAAEGARRVSRLLPARIVQWLGRAQARLVQHHLRGSARANADRDRCQEIGRSLRARRRHGADHQDPQLLLGLEVEILDPSPRGFGRVLRSQRSRVGHQKRQSRLLHGLQPAERRTGTMLENDEQTLLREAGQPERKLDQLVFRDLDGPEAPGVDGSRASRSSRAGTCAARKFSSAIC